ncbi:hypothetical protein PCASD_13464 [Puccinia coronata f. sp. avenae]|uniref:Uncharacterized protein n=1 Tax=Puccinia coronata f. sp. avenae TaxID=200324 RepID=A0A2N5TA86_9BASI|nr:hypothetical protein PCASD_13464 [Puccinia coronata f. sp. avenae]
MPLQFLLPMLIREPVAIATSCGSMEGNLHPDFRSSQPSPLAGLPQDNEFGRELGTAPHNERAAADDHVTPPENSRTAPAHGRTAPAADHQRPAITRVDLRNNSDDDYELPEDPIGDFFRETSPQRIPAAEVPVQLRALLHSGESTAEFAQRLFATRDADKWNIAVVMFIELSRQLHSLGHDVPTAAIDVLPGGPAQHVFSNTFKIFCRSKIREIMTTGNVDSYSTATTSDGQPILRTPLILLQTHIDAQEHPFARDLLPRGYPESTQAQLSLLTIMRTLLKHERGLLRAVVRENSAFHPPEATQSTDDGFLQLLNNIVEINRRRIAANVPNLRDLILKVDHQIASSIHPRNYRGIDVAYSGTTRIRIAFLRLSLAEYIFHCDRSSPLTTWEVIDRRLQHVRVQSRIFQHTFADLVVQKDQAAFPGNLRIAAINKDLIHVPTDAEVEAAMA